MNLPSRISVCLAACACLSSAAGEFSVKSIEKEPPGSFSDSIKTELRGTAVQVAEGDKPIYEIWLRKELPLKGTIDSPLRALNAVGRTSLLGAISVLSDERDYRDDELFRGDYTIRFDLRPEDGNHLGTSEHLYFAVLVEAENDRDLGEIMKSKQLAKASSKSSVNEHPVILSLYPVDSGDPGEPTFHEPAPEHKALRLSILAKGADGGESQPIVFDLVIEGTADF